MAEKQLPKVPENIADDRKVRLGDFAPYTEPAKSKLGAIPQEIADDQKVRMGDGAIYFAPDAKVPLAHIEDCETVRLGDYSPYL